MRPTGVFALKEEYGDTEYTKQYKERVENEMLNKVANEIRAKYTLSKTPMRGRKKA